jgi:hypothetical protein
VLVSAWRRIYIFSFFRYIVSKVVEHMTPQTYLDANSCGSFADYYSSKYNLEIVGKKNQPLLEVSSEKRLTFHISLYVGVVRPNIQRVWYITLQAETYPC